MSLLKLTILLTSCEILWRCPWLHLDLLDDCWPCRPVVLIWWTQWAASLTPKVPFHPELFTQTGTMTGTGALCQRGGSDFGGPVLVYRIGGVLLIWWRVHCDPVLSSWLADLVETWTGRGLSSQEACPWCPRSSWLCPLAWCCTFPTWGCCWRCCSAWLTSDDTNQLTVAVVVGSSTKLLIWNPLLFPPHRITVYYFGLCNVFWLIWNRPLYRPHRITSIISSFLMCYYWFESVDIFVLSSKRPVVYFWPVEMRMRNF